LQLRGHQRHAVDVDERGLACPAIQLVDTERTSGRARHQGDKAERILGSSAHGQRQRTISGIRNGDLEVAVGRIELRRRAGDNNCIRRLAQLKVEIEPDDGQRIDGNIFLDERLEACGVHRDLVLRRRKRREHICASRGRVLDDLEPGLLVERRHSCLGDDRTGLVLDRSLNRSRPDALRQEPAAGESRAEAEQGNPIGNALHEGANVGIALHPVYLRGKVSYFLLHVTSGKIKNPFICSWIEADGIAS
jgi:hypothetical protein